MTKHDIEEKMIRLNANCLLMETKYMELAKLFVDNTVRQPLRDKIWHKLSEQADFIVNAKNQIDELTDKLISYEQPTQS